jgi:alpha-tubulin suppressor-like RCC1 family protein
MLAASAQAAQPQRARSRALAAARRRLSSNVARAARPGQPEPGPGARVWAVGQGINGALGTGRTVREDAPVRMGGGELDEEEPMAQVAAGWGHTVLRSQAGQVWVCGRTHDVSQVIRFGRMAMSGSWFLPLYETLGARHSIDALRPARLELPEPAAAVAASAGLTAVLGRSGALYMAGGNWHGQCGIGKRETFQYGAARVLGLDGLRVAQVALGFRHCVALTACGKVLTWGKGQRGQLGLGPTRLEDAAVPVELGAKRLPGGRALEVAAGFNHCLALTEDGAVWQWGKFMGAGNAEEALADEKGRVPDASSPARVDFGGAAVRRIWAGQNHNLALTRDNKLFQWGRLSDRTVSVHRSVLEQVAQREEKLDTSRVLSVKDTVVHRPVAVPMAAEVLMDAAMDIAPGFDVSYLTCAGRLDQPLVWDWDLTPVPVHLHDPVLAPLLQDSRSVLQVAPGWIHTALLTDVRAPS